MFAKLFIVAMAVVCASAGVAERPRRDSVYPLAYTAGVVPYSYSSPISTYSTYSSGTPAITTYSSGAPVTTYSAYSGSPVAYSAYSGSPVAYSAYSAPVVASPYYYGHNVVV